MSNTVILDLNPTVAVAQFIAPQHVEVAFKLYTRDELNRKVPYDLTGMTFEVLDTEGEDFVPALTADTEDPATGVVSVVVDSATSAEIVDDSIARVWGVLSGERYCIGEIHFDLQGVTNG